jgi:DNA (cytosine-5)-methyltransferase 1
MKDKNKNIPEKEFAFIDLFAGIGGFHIAMHSVGGQCVFASEWDKSARITYEATYKEVEPQLFEKDEEGNYLYFNGDINDAIPENIPQFDVLCGGFPCQAFSIAGLRKGFEDTRGTLFFNIAEIVDRKTKQGQRPKVLFLENVKGLKNHMRGQTLETIKHILTKNLEYELSLQVLNAKFFGVPQNRERLFFVCWDKNQIPVDEFKFPFGIAEDGSTLYSLQDAKDKCKHTRVGDIFEPSESLDPKYTISDRLWIGHQERKKRNKANGKGFGYSLFSSESPYTSTISARYWKDGSEILIAQDGKNPRKLTPVEAGRLQGYCIEGAGWDNPKAKLQGDIPMRIVVSPKEAYHQFGNSVAVPVIKAIAREIKTQLLDNSL